MPKNVETKSKFIIWQALPAKIYFEIKIGMRCSVVNGQLACVARLRINSRCHLQKYKPSTLTIPPGTHLPITKIIPTILNSHSGASTIKTLFQRPAGGSRDSVVFGSSASGVKVGKST